MERSLPHYPCSVHDGEHTFYAYVDFVEMREYGGLSMADLLTVVPQDYEYSFFFLVDREALSKSDFPILVVDLHESSRRIFHTVATQVQGIENNLSIANMGFEEFAEAVDHDGIFRGFPA